MTTLMLALIGVTSALGCMAIGLGMFVLEKPFFVFSRTPP